MLVKTRSVAVAFSLPRCLGIPPIMEQALTYVNYILHAQEPSGWLGPSDAGADGNIYWGRFDVLLALTQYAEANATAFTSTAASVLAFCLEAHRRMQNLPLEGWSAARGMDFALTVQWLLTHAPQGHEQDLFELLDDIRKQTRLQGVDWENWFASFPPKEWPDFLNHGVNNAQALKSAAVWYVSSGDISLRAASLQRLAAMDATFGFPNGMFCADETPCAEAGQNNMPSRGSELCAVVEAMFSYATMFSVHGDAAFAERLERIAFNALPATWSSPSGGDMWAHQYLQAVNQVRSASDADHVWTHDGPDAELYGLEPNYGCCTANFNQGWPKFAHSLFFASADGGVAIAAYAQASANLLSGGHIKVDTEFPFSDTVNITIMTFSSSITLHLRIPSWSHATIVVVNGSPLPVPTPGTLLSIPLPPSSSSSSSVFLKFNPEIRIEHWCTFPPALPPPRAPLNKPSSTHTLSSKLNPEPLNHFLLPLLFARYNQGTDSVHRGALMFALPIDGSFSLLRQYAFQSADYSVLPMSNWSFALDVSQPMTFSSIGYQPGAAPFNKTAWPCTIKATLRALPSWGMQVSALARSFFLSQPNGFDSTILLPHHPRVLCVQI